MTLPDRIKHLRSILNKYSPAEINRLYSDNMRNRIIRDARSEKLTVKQLEMIAELIDMANGKGVELNLKELNKTSLQWIERLTEIVDNAPVVKLIHIEHEFEADSQDLEAWADHSYDEIIATVTTHYDLTPVWGVLNMNQFDTLFEKLEFVLVDNEFYGQIIDEVLKLQSYQFIKTSLLHSEVKELLQKSFSPELHIVFGEHDNWHYKIYPH